MARAGWSNVCAWTRRPHPSRRPPQRGCTAAGEYVRPGSSGHIAAWVLATQIAQRSALPSAYESRDLVVQHWRRDPAGKSPGIVA